MTATARDLLAMKNCAVVYTCPAGATVAEACRLLAERRVGALVVVDGSAVVGLFTEREVATRVVAAGLDPAGTGVTEVMRRDVPTVPLHATVGEVELLLRRRRVRHLPVVGSRGLLGVVSLGDLARFHAAHERLAVEGAEPPVVQ
jgi:CBS domain-containing protein